MLVPAPEARTPVVGRENLSAARFANLLPALLRLGSSSEGSSGGPAVSVATVGARAGVGGATIFGRGIHMSLTE